LQLAGISFRQADTIIGGAAMESMCTDLWPCNVLPPQWHWIMPIVMPVILILLAGIPIATILHRAGRSRWWTVLAFVPLLNLIGLWVFAFTRWPNLAGPAGR
jgi:hypothetical protein